jgi:4-amino-4-deoxy-L-arabinose transferase-like glycosyltransferase
MNRSKYILLAILAASVILRIGAAVYLGNTVEVLPGTNDQISYHALALRVLGGHGFSFGEPWWPLTAAGAPTAHWSFLYTFYLVFVYALFGPNPMAARLIQVLIVGVLQPYLAYRIGKRLFQAPTGLFAAGLTALYPYFVYYSAALMTEPFFILAVLASLWAAISLGDRLAAGQPMPGRTIISYGLLLGLCMGAAVLLRQLFLLFVPLLFLWLWLANIMKLNKGLVLSALVAGSIVIALILPFTFYNYSRFHRFVLLNTNSGYVFYWANHPIYGTRFIPILPPEKGTYLDLIPPELRRMDEAALDQELLSRGMAFVVADPARYLMLSLSRIPAFFMFWPSQESGLISNISRAGGFGLLIPFIIYGLIRAFIRKPPVGRFTFSSPLFLLIIFILFFTTLHLLSWALIRYRLPVDAVLLIFAGLAFADLALWVETRVMISHQLRDNYSKSPSHNLKG